MGQPTWDRIESVFFDALERSPEERPAFLQGACADDPALLREVEAMLHAHEIDRPLKIEERLVADAAPEGALVGTSVGAWRLTRLIASGGMGDVYLGERSDGFEQRVAIKFVRAGHRTRDLHDRFEQERRILARLSHPNIGTLYDGGVTEDGHPFLVMEYIDGVPITVYCDRHRLGLEARLRLFESVCEAVRFAHGNLVIHRDLKPSNVFVSTDGHVKLLDFGIAKLIDTEADSTGDATRPLDRRLTPEYAAPEQIRGEPVSTAADVYALGVLLYEMLTGVKPLEFPTRSPVEIERIATEREPEPPSEALRKAPDGPAAADRRDTGLSNLVRSLRGDLDAICLTALRKEPQRRYASAGALAEDIRRHLGRLPVHARRDTTGYRTRRFVRRNRAWVTATAAVLVLVLGWAITTAVQSRRVVMERDRAQIEQQRSERVVGAMLDLFEATSPDMMPGSDTLSVRTLLERGEHMTEALSAEPYVQGRMWELLGNIYEERTQLDRALDMFERALSVHTDPLAIARLEHRRAVVTFRRRGFAEGEPLLRASLEWHQERFGPDHPDVAQAMQDLAMALTDYDEKRELLDEALRIRRASGSPLDLAANLNALGSLELEVRNLDASIAAYEASLEILSTELPPDHPRVLTVRHNLATVLAHAGHWAAVEPVQRELLESRRRLFGDHSDVVANSWQVLGVTQANLGNMEAASESFRHALEAFEAAYGTEHWQVANCSRNVGQLLVLQRRYDEGLPYLERAIAIKVRMGEYSRSTVYVEGQVAMARLGLGDTGVAIAELERVARDMETTPGTGGPGYSADASVWLGTARLYNGDPKGAEAAFRRALELRASLVAPDHPRIAEAQSGLGAALAGQERFQEAGPILGDYLPAYERWGLAHPVLLDRVRPAQQATRSALGHP